MRQRSIVLLMIGCAVIGAWAGLAGTPVSADTPKTAWKVVGQLEEACSCSAACPCWFNSKPTRMACSGGQFVFIDKGHYGSVKLDGLAMGAMSKSPDGKGMMESFGNWDYNYYYLDAKATPEQRDALKALAKTILVPNASPKEEIRVIPIVRTITGKEHKISLGEYGEFTGHLIDGGMGGAVKIVNPPGADPLHKEYAQGLTTSISYNDAGASYKHEGSNYMFGTFEIDSAQYEKFAAGLAQKMADMKKE
jgi:hypothetical protein